MPLPRRKKTSKEIQVEIPQKYTLIAADLSLKRPGFCVINVDQKDNKPSVMSIKLVSVDNKTKTKPRGQLLEEILLAFKQLLDEAEKPVFLVREQSINNCGGKMAHSSTAARTGVSSVVGVMDWSAWHSGNLGWEELYPTTIKKLLTGNGRAEKHEVAQVLSKYIGEQPYKNDDESDAAAVAVAWMITHNQMKQIIQEDVPSERTEESNCSSDGRSVGKCAAQAA